MVPDHNYHKIVSWVRWAIAMEMSLLSNLGPGSKLSGHFVHAWVVPQSPIYRHRVDFYSVREGGTWDYMIRGRELEHIDKLFSTLSTFKQRSGKYNTGNRYRSCLGLEYICYQPASTNGSIIGFRG